ncbi:hypothetical protein LJC15_04435, partial [Desulfovibrio sp. OttesenSCG-928-G11]|nr:hypothetical protein [Desulfovibrio sp. OttesenSCG-928-G11]
MIGMKLDFAGIIMDCWYDENGNAKAFLCIPANPSLAGHPVCLDCLVINRTSARLGRETIFPGALVSCTAYDLSDYDEEGTLDLRILPSDMHAVTDESERLALYDALLDPLLDAAMLGRRCWYFVESEEKIWPRQLLQLCLDALKAAGLLQPDRLTRRVHGWLSGYWLTSFSEESIGIPDLKFMAAIYNVGGTPRIFICPHDNKDREVKANMFSVSVSPRPRVLEGSVFVSEETLALCLTWVRLNRKPLLKHWRGRIASDGLFSSMT